MFDEATADFNLGHCCNTGVKVQPNSYFAKYFIKEIGPILELGENTLIDQNLKFKHRFLETLCSESETLKTIFEPMFENRRKELSYWRVFSRKFYTTFTQVVQADPDHGLLRDGSADPSEARHHHDRLPLLVPARHQSEERPVDLPVQLLDVVHHPLPRNQPRRPDQSRGLLRLPRLHLRPDQQPDPLAHRLLLFRRKDEARRVQYGEHHGDLLPHGLHLPAHLRVAQEALHSSHSLFEAVLRRQDKQSKE